MSHWGSVEGWNWCTGISANKTTITHNSYSFPTIVACYPNLLLQMARKTTLDETVLCLCHYLFPISYPSSPYSHGYIFVLVHRLFFYTLGIGRLRNATHTRNTQQNCTTSTKTTWKTLAGSGEFLG